MSLSLYKKKRKFNQTPEPRGKEEGSSGVLRFVVQKHNASHLHYDFRLEMKGVLKSWAVPKGPSMNPGDKRLAMMVEDHPYAYKDFEGIIPEGNYGAGTVIIWDEGTYEPAEPVKGGKAEMEKILLQELHKGTLPIRLHGHKLKGEFALVHTKSRGDNAWLLIKKKDKDALTTDITQKNKSVISGLTIEQVAKTSTNEWHSNRSSGTNPEKQKAGPEAGKPSAPWYIRTREKKKNGSAAEPALQKDKKGPVRAGAQKTAVKKTTRKAAAKETGSPKTVAQKTGTKKTTGKISTNETAAKETNSLKTVAQKITTKKNSISKTTANETTAKKGSTHKTTANKTGAKKNSTHKTSANKTPVPKTAVKKTVSNSIKKKPHPDIGPRIEQGTPTSFPSDLTPMLATLADHPFDDQDWLFEIKWDGYRALSYLKNGEVQLRSRNNISFNEKYSPVAEALEGWNVNAVLDGEIISVNEKGRSDFQQLQIWQKEHKGELQYYLFDILWLEGYSLTDLPLVERKAILKDIIPPDHPVIKYSDHVEQRGKEFFEAAVKEGLEGIMAKLAAGSYHPGARTQQWLKIKTHKRQEAIICGFTQPRRSRKLFGALVLGIYDDKRELTYIGHTGSGFDEKGLKEMYKKLEPLITDKCPFKVKPITNMPCTWVKPKYVCELKYTEWTKDNSLRHPIFLGLREDKKPSEVKREEPKPVDPGKIEKQELSGKKEAVAEVKKIITSKKSPGKPSQGTLFQGSQNDQVVNINGHEIKFSNLKKVYWPKEKITKRDMLEYYHAITPVILPYMKDRPQSLNRHPDGIAGPNFFQKDVTGKVADWLTTYAYTSESDREKKQFLVCTDEASLLYMANLGCIEMNPWHSRTASPDNPDWCVVDLDPDNIDFAKVIETANVVKSVTDELGMPTFCKTSGSRGLHIYIPLGAKYSYDQSRQLAELVVTLVNQELPDFTSLERNPARRKGRIYLDFLQNRSIQTIAAPYSLRPRPGATVSTPLHWEEVKKGLSVADFNIFTIHDRVREEGDIFKGVLGKGIDLEKVLEKAGSLAG